MYRDAVYIDVETKSDQDIKLGPYRYFESPVADVQILSYALRSTALSQGNISEANATVWLPSMLRNEALCQLALDPSVRFIAFNAEFEIEAWERIMVGKYGYPSIPLYRWYDIQAVAMALGYPAALNKLCEVLELDNKHPEGARLIKKFAKPQKDGSFIDPYEHQEDFKKYISYNQKDTILLHQVAQKLNYELTKYQQTIWQSVVLINKRGIPFDVPFINNIVDVLRKRKHQINALMNGITEGAVPRTTMRAKFAEWIYEMTGRRLADTTGTSITAFKKEIDAALEYPELEKTVSSEMVAKLKLVRHAIGFFEEGNLSSTAKFIKIQKALCKDGRVRGCLKAFAAGTGRLGGRVIQPQNFPNKSEANADKAAELVGVGDLTLLELVFGNIFKLAKRMTRPSIKASSGMAFIVYDFKSIEAVAAAFVVGETQIVEGFKRGLCQYRVTASDMYKKSYAAITTDERQAGKVTVLACQFGGWANAVLGMAKKFGLKISEMQAADWAGRFRNSRPLLVQSWTAMEDTARRALKGPEGKMWAVPGVFGASFMKVGKDLRLYLPSGRFLNYPNCAALSIVAALDKEMVEIHSTLYGSGKSDVLFELGDLKSNNYDKGQWTVRSMYGSLFFQNYIQGFCADILFNSQIQLQRGGFDVILDVHDELGSENLLTTIESERARFHSTVTTHPSWLPNSFPLMADGGISKRYPGKD